MRDVHVELNDYVKVDEGIANGEMKKFESVWTSGTEVTKEEYRRAIYTETRGKEGEE